MYGVLKRLATLFVMIGESVFLEKKATFKLQQSIALIVIGAVIAGTGDLSFEISGYVFALLSTLVQAAYLLYVAKTGAEKGMNTFGLLFYNSLLAIPFVLFVLFITSEIDDIRNYEQFWKPDFQICLWTNLLFGMLLNFSMFLCTTVNSALTTTIMGNLKNLLSVFLGLIFLDPPPITVVNIIGLTINAIGGLYYSYIKYAETNELKYRLPQTNK